MGALVNQDFGEFREYITEINRRFNGGQIVFKFPNGYGASLVNHFGSYGNEIAVLKGDDIYYGTEVTDDVLGYLEQREILLILHKIKNLSKATAQGGEVKCIE